MPIEDYSGAFAPQSPTQAFAGGYQLGAGIRDDFQQQQALQAKAEQQQAERQRQGEIIQSLLTKKNPTAADYANASVLLPSGMREQLDQAWKMRSTEQQESAIRDMGQAYSAILSGRADVAVRQMQSKADAMEAAGASPSEVQALRTNAQVVQENPNLGALTLHRMLSFVPGGDKVLAGLSTAGQENRAADQAPAALLQKKAEARIKAGEAGIVDEKVRADVDLTKAQIAESQARVDKLKMEADAASAGGSLDPEKRFDFESKLRKEYATQTANFQEVREAFNRIKSVENNGAGDIALVYSYMKMLDPGSVVREGEFATASNSAGIPAAISNLYNKAINGERLTEGQRKTFTGQAAKLLSAAESREKEVRAGILPVVNSYKLNPDNVFYRPEADKPAGNASAAGALPPALAGKGWAKY